ncbi:MAG: glycosyltransferase family 39 protein [Verrucomicrobia bacterium]|nr:glycosyltransferase family 39 protein [Verrucomicrobiota bacterium]
MATAQTLVHSVEQGKGARIIRIAIVVVALIGVCFMMLTPAPLGRFRGFNHLEAMDSAQVARHLANGKGFTTGFIRPLALWQMERNNNVRPNLGKSELPDTANLPLWPLISVLPLKIASEANYKPGVFLPPAEQWIAAVGILFFLASVAVFFFFARKLFDQGLALLGSGLLLVTDLFWQFSTSGLPHMLLMFFFMCAMYCLVRSVEENLAGRLATTWFAAVGALFGLMALTHGLAVWPFLGLLVFAGFYFRPRGLSVGVMSIVFLAVISPWLIRNYTVCGNIFGIAYYSHYEGVKGTLAALLRSNSLDSVAEVTPMWWRPKMQVSVLAQFGGLYGLLGTGLIAPLFFVSLLHPFKRRETADFRWAILAMWIFAVIGMAFYGLAPQYGSGAIDQLSSNQIHVIFVPLMIAFGLAFLLIMVRRLEFSTQPLLFIAFMVIVYLVSAIPLIGTLLPSTQSPIRMPPYFAPVTNMLQKWTDEKEVLVSDQPWAVAWYADRRCVWLPTKISDMIRQIDYNELGAPLAGVFLTPATGHLRMMPEVFRGEYRDWYLPILRNTPPTFPFKEVTGLPPDQEFVFFTDKKRWELAPKDKDVLPGDSKTK